jgi:hypothetical protein
MALSDPLEMLINIKHLESPHVAIDNYKKGDLLSIHGKGHYSCL